MNTLTRTVMTQREKTLARHGTRHELLGYLGVNPASGTASPSSLLSEGVREVIFWTGEDDSCKREQLVTYYTAQIGQALCKGEGYTAAVNKMLVDLVQSMYETYPDHPFGRALHQMHQAESRFDIVINSGYAFRR